MKSILLLVAILGITAPVLSYAIFNPIQGDKSLWTHEVAKLIEQEQSANHHLHYYNFWTGTSTNSATEPIYLDQRGNYVAHYFGNLKDQPVLRPGSLSFSPIESESEDSYQFSVGQSGYFSLPLYSTGKEQCLVVFSVGGKSE